GRYEIVRLDTHVDEAADDVGDVVGVDGSKDQVSGERGLDGDLCGFLVADFADHDFVGVMTEDGAQTSGEGQSFLFVDRNLGDSAKLVFDGVFDGDDLVFVGLDFVDGGVEGGGFSGTGGTGNEHHAVGLANVAPKAAHLFLRKTDNIETEALKLFRERLLVENAKDGIFAVAGGHDGNAQVYIAPLVLNAESTV